MCPCANHKHTISSRGNERQKLPPLLNDKINKRFWKHCSMQGMTEGHTLFCIH